MCRLVILDEKLDSAGISAEIGFIVGTFVERVVIVGIVDAIILEESGNGFQQEKLLL